MRRILMFLFMLCACGGQIANAQNAAPSSPAQPVSQTMPESQGEAPEIERLLEYQSIMFTQEEIKKLREIVEALKTNGTLPIHPSEVQAGEAYIYPQFYLKSIAYYGPKNWVVWVNDGKITSSLPAGMEGLEIQQISSEQVTFQYQFRPDDKSDFSAKVEDERVSLDKFEKRATFMLHPNQTFSSYNWKIYEGKVEEVVAKKMLPATPGAQPGSGSPNPELQDIFPATPNDHVLPGGVDPAMLPPILRE